MRSDKQFVGIERSLQRAWAKCAGLIDEEFERPSGRDLDVAAEVLSERWFRHAPAPARVTRGYLKHYSEHVAPASEGAVMPPGRAWT